MKQYVLHTKLRAKVIASQEDLLFQFDNWGIYVTKTARAGFVYCQNAAVCTVSEAFIFADSYLQLQILAFSSWTLVGEVVDAGRRFLNRRP